MTFGEDVPHLIDSARSADLRDVGGAGYIAATAVSPDGTTHLVLSRLDLLSDDSASYEPDCPDVAHEQPGPLPLDFVRRVAISQRAHRRPPR